MDPSYAQPASVTCRRCGEAFSVDLWLIVDAGERPDLLERVREGALHVFSCPRCGQTVEADAPLLLYFSRAPLRLSGREVRLLFSPARRTRPQEDEAQAGALLARLREALGPAWREEWLREGLPVLLRSLLPLFLREDPEAAPRALTRTLEEFIGARTWEESRRILEAHPELLTDEADALLGQWIAAAQARGDEEARRILEEHRVLLRRCREVGIEEAFAERRWGSELVQTLFAFIQAETWEESRRILEAHPELLTDEADAVLGQLVQVQEDQDARRFLEELRALLRRCREVGVEQAFAELSGPPIPPEFQADLRRAQEGKARYRQTGDLAVLNEAIAAYERILNHPAFSQADERFRLWVWNDAGNAYIRRYWRTGSIADLDKALALWQQAVEATPPDSPDRPMFLNNLGTGLRERYERTGRLEDLEAAIRVFREAVEATPPDSPNRPSRLTSLGNGLRARYERTGRLEDLEEAIRVFREAVEAAPPGSPNRPGFLNNLGGGLFRRYERTGRLEDLEEAIRVYREAVEATSPDSPDRPGILNNLGAGLSDRYERTGRLEDLEEAIRVFREAVEATPPGSPDRPGILNNLGIGLRDRYERTGRLEDLEEAIRVFREACVQGLQSNPPHALGAGRNWLVWAFRRGAWEEALEAHGYAVQAAEALLSSQFGYPDKAFSLGEAQGLPARAAFSAWRRGQPTKAVEIVEQGRAQLLREALERRRRDLHALAGTPYEPYYTAYIQATRHLDDLQAIPYPQRPPDWGIRIARALAAQQAAIEALRQNVPGFAYFLKSMPFSEIQRQAAEAPLVYMLTTQYGGLALIVRAGGEPQAVELPELTEEALRDRLNAYFGAYARWRDHPQDQSACQAWFAALDEACRWLWDVAMGRVVEALAGARSAVLIPTGLLGFLPFHAAWREDPAAPTGRRYALDDLLLTYAPSAHALAAARQVAARAPADRLFAVDNPDGSLLFSEEEVAAALKHFAPDQRRLLGGEAATRKAVLKEIPRYSVLHFSTHGRADLEEPLRSGLWMADGALSLGDLMDLRLEGARLAVLSACETGLPGAKLPEEAVSLPSGLIQAGVAGVVGSLWAVSDVSTALLMARFYDLWRKEGLEPPEALRQAQIWLRDSTNAEKEAFFRHALPELGATRLAERAAWVAFWDAVVRRPQDRDFAHPFHWAAFSYMGA